MKKRILVFLLIIIVIVGVLIAYLNGLFYKPSAQQERFMTEIDAANTIVWYYGNPKPDKEITINCKEISEFTKETIGDEDKEYTYHMIVIFDFDGTMEISNEELMLIKKYCEQEFYDLLYYGTAHLEQFKECGFFEKIDENDDYGFTYNGSYWMNREVDKTYINPYLLTGNWTKDDNERYDVEDEHMMWKFLVSFIHGMIYDES